MDVKSEVNKNGAINPHSITSINEVPGGIIRKSGDQLRNAQAPRSGSSVSQNSENANNSVTKLADLGYDVSKEIGSRAKKVAKKAADVANKHPLGGTTKFVDSPEIEDGGTDVLDKRSELIGDKFDYMKYAKKVGNEPDHKGKHDFANNWDEYITKNVKFSNGDVADVRNVIANNAEGKGNLYTADYNITKNGSSGKEPASGKNPSRYGASTKSNVSQNSENVNNSVTKLADLGYDVSKEIGSRAKKVAKKAADVANKHPLGGTTKLVYIPEVESSGPERRKVLNFSGLEDPVKRSSKEWQKDDHSRVL